MNELKEQILGAIKDLCPDKSAQGSRDYIEFLIDQYTTRKELEAKRDELNKLLPMFANRILNLKDNAGYVKIKNRITQLSTQLSNQKKGE